jgi:hypothetical protein
MSAQNNSGDGEGKSLSDLAVQRRQEIRALKNLGDAPKLLFDALSDLCFLDRYSVAFGVVRSGKPKLADLLGCSIASITRRQKQLADSKHIWTRTGWHEGHEITLWFLRGIASPQLEFDQFTEGITRMAVTRVAPRVQPLRNGHGHFCKLPETLQLPINEDSPTEATGHPGQKRPGTTVRSDGATRSKVTGVNGQKRPPGPVKSDRGQRSEVTGPHGHFRGGHPVKSDAGTRSEVTVYRKDKDTGIGDTAAPPPEFALEDWIKDIKNRKPPLYPRELQDIKTKLLEQRRTTPGVQSRLFINAKIKAVDELMIGPTPPAETSKTGPVRVAVTPQKRNAMTKDEILIGARWLIDNRKSESLTAIQKATLKEAGISIPKQKAAATAAA